jgi:hypothetical protein
MCAGAAVQKLMMKISDEQEVLMYLADMIIDTFAAESALLRAMKMNEANHANKNLATDIAQILIADTADQINHAGKNAINAFADGDEQRMMLMGMKRFTKTNSFNTKNARRRIAAKLIENQRYFF